MGQNRMFPILSLQQLELMSNFSMAVLGLISARSKTSVVAAVVVASSRYNLHLHCHFRGV